MGVILPAQAAALAAELREDGPKATKLLGDLATHFAQTKTRIEAILALPESDDSDRAIIAADLQSLVDASDMLRAEVVAYIASLTA